MSPRVLALSIAVALCGCQQQQQPARSLVDDGPAPGVYALAGDTITVWKRVRQPDGLWRFHSWSITPGGTVEYLDTPEGADTPGELEESPADLTERRKSFTLPQSEFEAMRAQVALLRPVTLGPEDPVGGYGGEAYPRGCTPDKAQQRTAGINFLNKANWGSFVLPDGCASEAAKQAATLMNGFFGRFERAASSPPPTSK